MRKAGLYLLVFLTVVFFAVLPCITSFSEEIGLGFLLNGEISSPVAVSFSSPVYRSLAQFDNKRLESLNRLIRHLGVEIRTDGAASETTVSVDGDPVYSLDENTSGPVSDTVFSFDPGSVYNLSLHEPDSSFFLFLDHQFFLINRMLDDMYYVFSGAANAFSEYAKSSDEKINYKDFGKSVRKVTITLPSEYVRDNYQQELAKLAATEESLSFIRGLTFNGTQKIVLYYNQDDQVIRINYDGTLGLTDESMRKVSLSWRCFHSDSRTKDDISLKTPSVKGFDRYNLNYVRDLDQSDESDHSLLWDFQLDLKSGEVKKKIRFNSELIFSGGKMRGNAVFSEKQDRQEYKVSILPEIRKENDQQLSGTLEITVNSGKIITSSLVSDVRISPCEKLVFAEKDPATATDMQYGAGTYTEEEIRAAMDSLLVRRLLSLPEEDLEFLKQDIPEDLWKSIEQSMF